MAAAALRAQYGLACIVVLMLAVLLHLQEVDICEDGRPLQEVWMCLEYCNRYATCHVLDSRSGVSGSSCLPLCPLPVYIQP